MPKSINQDIRAGNSIYHIQTEYYKSSGKIVTNIFKDGLSIKRLEREVEELPDEELDREIEKFHSFVLEKIKGSRKGERPAEEGTFSIPEELYEKLLLEISPFFGIASSFVLNEALESSKGVEGFIEKLVSDLPEDKRIELASRLRSIFKDFDLSKAQNGEPKGFEFTDELKSKVLTVLSEYFGIMALAILEDSLSQWSGNSYEELVDLIVSHADSNKEAQEIRTRLMFL